MFRGLLILLAEAVRFELTNESPRRQFSRLVPSTARPRFLSGRHYAINLFLIELQTQKFTDFEDFV
jgi:hypothetical protein